MRLIHQLPWARMVKFALVGGSAFAIDFGIYFALTRLGHLPYLPSRVGSIACAFSWNFLLNRQWTFRAQAGRVSSQAVRFVTVMGITSLLNLGLMHIAITRLHWNDLLTLLAVSILIMGINFLAHSLWSYKLH